MRLLGVSFLHQTSPSSADHRSKLSQHHALVRQVQVQTTTFRPCSHIKAPCRLCYVPPFARQLLILTQQSKQLSIAQAGLATLIHAHMQYLFSRYAKGTRLTQWPAQLVVLNCPGRHHSIWQDQASHVSPTWHTALHWMCRLSRGQSRAVS